MQPRQVWLLGLWQKAEKGSSPTCACSNMAQTGFCQLAEEQHWNEGDYRLSWPLTQPVLAQVREQLGDALRAMARSGSADRSVKGGAAPEGGGGNALIIDGKALQHALADDTRDALLAVSHALGRIPLSGQEPRL